jgi:Zn-dependent protease
MLYIDKTGLFFKTFLSIILHESGHLFAMYKTGCAPRKIKVIPASIQITNSHSTGYKNDAIIALAGPLVNLAVFVVFYPFKVDFLREFSVVNLALFLFNLLAVKGLDGGVILGSFLCRKYGVLVAERVLKFVTFLLGFSVIFAAFLSVYFGKINPSLFVFGVYLVFYGALKG